MVVNRLCDPCSKLALLEWLNGMLLVETTDLISPPEEIIQRSGR